MKMLLGIISISFLSITCKVEEHASPPKQVSKMILDTVWTAYIGGYSNNPITNSNGDVLMSKVFDNPEGEKFKLYDGKTGKLKWEWHDYFTPEYEFSDNKHILIKDILALCSEYNTYAFDIKTGKTIWRSSMPNLVGSSQFYAGPEEYIYQGYWDRTRTFKNYFYRTKYDKGNWELVCTFEDSTKQFDVIYSSPVAFSKNNKGEQIMVYTLHLLSSRDGDIYASKVCGFNLVTNKFEWVRDYSDKYYEFMICNMQSNNEKVFTFATYGSKRYLIAINANDGSIAWEQIIPDLGVGLFSYKDMVIPTCNGNNPLTAYNQTTGKPVWSNPLTGLGLELLNFTFGDAIVYKNYLISTQGDNLLVVNLDGGGVLYKEKIALPKGYLQFGVAINEKERLLYVQDRLRVVCYKLPDEIK
ncbi:MAG: PQQ-binding-like beta-propeller repeat protein [Bacteroidia bacterium]|nr:PQQ-binding-like beta-propeller repeat protein [Bacteroidia bacterium]MCF8427296.1 PQQ-binding-like beta-propeller repeat protein [Bacteroidia bacterium]MCF8447874.1 PQQ-binding-like beta-propeller repeat protein [Bacteroidia bacterium]